MRKSISILGSTGSIGRSTVDVIKGHSDKFKVIVLTANKNVKLLAEQAIKLEAEYAVIGDKNLYEELKELLKNTSINIEAGYRSIVDAGGISADVIMAAIVGAAGVESTFKAIRQGTSVALANKESLVCAGKLMMQEVEKFGTKLLPVDSEHNAVFQVFEESKREQINRIILTASGGPFLRKKRSELENITPEEAIKHPTWFMGAKISIDSATMVNKSLEIIEASYLFNLKHKDIDVLIHPQSIVHSMVEYIDGSILAQMGAPDMRTPISNVLNYPERIKTTGARLDLRGKINLTFEQIDLIRFPSIKMAKNALEVEKAAPSIFNAANEVAVDAFLNKKIKFSSIENVIDEVLQKTEPQIISSLEDVFFIDKMARSIAEKVVAVVN